jgi:hypothetical protein
VPVVPSAVGTYAVVATFTSSDPNYGSTTVTSTLTISARVATPTVRVSGGTFPYIGGARDVGAAAIGTDGLTQVPGTFTFTYNGSANAPINVGTYAVVATFTSDDPSYGSATGSGTLRITPVAPIGMTFTGGNFPQDGTAHVANATATGVNGELVSGAFKYTYNGSSTAPSAVGTYAIVATFTSSDPNYLDTTGTGTLTISAGPATPTLTVAGGTFPYDGKPHPDQAVAYGGDGLTPVPGNYTFTYNGSPDAPTLPGVYVVAVTFTSSDPHYTNASATGIIGIAPGQAVPTVTLSPEWFTYDGKPHPVTATFVGTDGRTPVPGTVAFTYNGSPTPPSAVGQYLVDMAFTSSDLNYASVTGVNYLTILAAPTVSVTGGSFIYDGADHPASATAYNVDGVTPLGGSFTFTYNGSATAPRAAGTYAVVATFTSDDPNYGTATGTGTIIISAITPPTVVPPAGGQSAVEGSNVAIQVGSFTDPGTNDGPFQVDVNWGDGSPHGLFTAAAPGSLGTLPHTYPDNGNYRVTVRVTEQTGGAGQATFKVAVNNAPPVVTAPAPPSMIAGAAATIDLGSFADPGTLDQPWVVNVDWGDGSGLAAFAVAQTGSLGNRSYTYADAGNYEVTVRVTDKDGATGQASFEAMVKKGTPASQGLALTAIPVTVSQGTLAQSVAVGRFTDPVGARPAGTYSATITWGDGTPPSAGSIVAAGDSFRVVGSHNFLAPGRYSVTVVVHGPSGGLVTAVGSAVIGSQQQRWVAHAYQDLYGQPIGRAELHHWLQLLQQSNSRRTVALSMQRTEAYSKHLVRSLYQEYLGRAPSAVELRWLLGSMNSGGPVEEVKALILASGETWQRAQGTTAHWLEHAYSMLTGEVMDPPAQAFYQRQLADGVPRGRVAWQMVNSRATYRQMVRQVYGRYLHRGPEPQGLTAWMHRLESGVGLEGFTAGVLASREHFAHV